MIDVSATEIRDHGLVILAQPDRSVAATIPKSKNYLLSGRLGAFLVSVLGDVAEAEVPLVKLRKQLVMEFIYLERG